MTHISTFTKRTLDLSLLLGTIPDSKSSSEAWMLEGICRNIDPDLWFPDAGGSTRAPISMCQRCPVKQRCLDYAMDNEIEYGVWGGTSNKQRKAMRAASSGQ